MKLLRVTLPAFLLFFFLGCAEEKMEVRLAGRTMGTTYHISVVAGPEGIPEDLQGRIDRRLEAINRSMSTYRDDSEISRFNRLQPAGTPFAASADFYRVMSVAERLHRLTGGAWDGTVAPLVELWGFGRREAPLKVPSGEAVRRALQTVGFGHIALEGGALVKRIPGVTVDLASIAKGFGVDAAARVIRQAGCRDFLVEIGGEVAARGRRPDGEPWRVGINTPRPGAPPDSVHRAVPLSDRALATSGTYRQFFTWGGRLYSHVLDPRTGYPVAAGVVSATVVAGDCTLADGLATALMVMAPDRGLALVEGLEGVECLLVLQRPDGRLEDRTSSGFPH